MSCYFAAGELSLPVICLFSRLRCACYSDHEGFRLLNLENAGAGFTLPANIDDLDPTVANLDLIFCNLIGL